MKKLRAFFTGMREFRSGYTTNYCWELMGAYDAGRELAHRLTFRRFESW